MTTTTEKPRSVELKEQQFYKEYYQGIKLIVDDPKTQTQMKLYQIEAFTNQTKKRLNDLWE